MGNGAWLSFLWDRGFSEYVATKTNQRKTKKTKLPSFLFLGLTLIVVNSFPFAEQRKLKKTDVPLLQRLVQGPSKSNARIFLMDKDAEEISSDVWAPAAPVCLRLHVSRWLGASYPKTFCFPFQVAPYINFHFSFLESILQRLDEEEKMETERIMAKWVQSGPLGISSFCWSLP